VATRVETCWCCHIWYLWISPIFHTPCIWGVGSNPVTGILSKLLVVVIRPRIAKAPTNMSGGTIYNGSIMTILEPSFHNLQTEARPYSSSRDKRIHQIIIWDYPISRETWPHIPHPKSSLPSGVSATITSRLVESTLGCLRTSPLFRSTWPLSLWGALSWQCQQSRCRVLNMPPIQGMIWLFWSALSSTGSHWMWGWLHGPSCWQCRVLWLWAVAHWRAGGYHDARSDRRITVEAQRNSLFNGLLTNKTRSSLGE